MLKYPLLIQGILDCTPDDHPDYMALQMAFDGIKKAADHINQQKKRKDIVDKMVGRKQNNNSDIRHGFAKLLARRTEKLKQTVGLSEIVKDDNYVKHANTFGEHFCHIQIVKADIEMYTKEVQVHIDKLHEMAKSIRAFIEASPSVKYPEVEAKWRKFEETMRDVSTTVFNDHVRGNLDLSSFGC